jgi:anaphase-promoting complex subunit 2
MWRQQTKTPFKDSHPGVLALAVPAQGGRSEQRDLLWTLVNIYGSKELFVNEYRSMLADRLLEKTDFDTEQ